MKALLALLLFIPATSFGLDNCRITRQTVFGATTVNTIAIPAKGNRRCLAIENVSNNTNIVHIGFNGIDNVNGKISLGSSVVWMPIVPPMNAIWLKASNMAAGTSVLTTILEGE